MTTAEERRVYEAVMDRDQGCVAPRVDAASGPCAGRLTREHVRPGGGAMGAKRVTRLDAVVILCERHHLWTSWATGHKQLLREYLKELTDDRGTTAPGVHAPDGDTGRPDPSPEDPA